MTVQNACLIFIVCFSAITGWLMFREPVSLSMTSANAQAVERKAPENKAATPPSVAISQERLRLDKLVIPVLDFREVALEEAVDFLNLKSSEMENSGQTLKFIIRKADSAITDDSEHTISVYLEDVTFADALDLICEEAGCRWELSDHQVIIQSLEE